MIKLLTVNFLLSACLTVEHVKELDEKPVRGALKRREIASTVTKNLAQVRHCYERYLERNPGKSGKVTVKFVIDKDGHVSTINIHESDISDRSFLDCITSRIKTWKFPRPRGGSNVTVNYPFVFNPL